MNIATRTKVITLLSVILVAVFGASLLYSFNQKKKSAAEDNISDQMNQKIMNLNILTNDYLLNRSERVVKQWWSVYDGIGRLCAPAVLSTQEQKDILDEIIKKHAHISDVFSSLLILNEKISKGEVEEEQENRLFSQFLLDSQSLSTLSLKFHTVTIQHSLYHQRLEILLMMSLFIALFVILIVNSYWLLKKMVLPISKLYEGTEIIGSGNLDLRVGTDARDEIGQLSRAFDRMTDNLKNVMASRDELNKEIARRKQVEQVLKQEKDKTQSYLNIAGVMFVVLDAEARVILINKKGCEILGCHGKDEIIGKNWFDNFLPQDIQAEVKIYYAKLMAGEIKPVEYFENPVLSRSGEQRIIAWYNSVVTDEGGNIIGTISSGEDITARKKAEERLKLTVEELARSNKELEQFAYIASHDLQEPLRMIASFLQLIEKRYKGKLDKDADEFIAFAVDGARRLQEMITGLLSYSRIETRKGSFEKVNTAEILGKVISNLTIAIEENGAIITSDRLPGIYADEAQFIQLFQNLISNSIKFRGSEQPVIHVSAERKDAEWLFSVRDNGIGIAPEYKDRIFNIFQRLHGREYPGVGIGLSVCRRIVERHGGRIWLESEVGKGTSFYFTIPAEQGIGDR